VNGRLYVGTSGWNYDSWREHFYGDTPKKNWLRFCAERFTAIEVNATFYRLQTRETSARWRKETPRNFRFAIKANRYLTHNKKLKDPLPAIRLERDRATGLGNKLAVVVWQLPHNFKKNLDRLETFARALNAWRTVRHTIEFRHTSWFDDEVQNYLEAYRIAICQSDAADWPTWDAVSTDLVYFAFTATATPTPRAMERRGSRCGSEKSAAGCAKAGMCTVTLTMMPWVQRRRMWGYC